MAELTLNEIIQRLSIHRDENDAPIGAAINELMGALGVSDFLEKVCLHCYIADLPWQGFDESQIADHNLYVNRGHAGEVSLHGAMRAKISPPVYVSVVMHWLRKYAKRAL